MSKYIGWKYYYSTWYGLDFIDTKYLPHYPKSQNRDECYELADKFFQDNCAISNLSLEGNSAPRVIAIKVGDQNILEELRIIDLHYFDEYPDYPNEDYVKLNIPLGKKYNDEGFTTQIIEEPYQFNLESGNLSLINHYAYQVNHSQFEEDKKYEVGELVANSLEKNNLQLASMNINKNNFEKIGNVNLDSSQFGFSFTWEIGEYDVFFLKLEKHKIIIPDEEITMNFPCCNRKETYNAKNRVVRWGVTNLYCEKCDKHNTSYEKCLTYKGENIDFETHCIKGYKDRIESVNYSTVIRPSRFKNDIEWI